MLGMFKAKTVDPATPITLPDLNLIAKQTKFVQRKSRKLTPEAFLLMLMQAVASGGASFSGLADLLGQNNQLVSMAKQSLWERFNKYTIAFLLKVNESLILQRLDPVRSSLVNSSIQRIIIEDSTHIVLPKSNAEAFPAHGNHHGATAGAKIDLAYDLLSGSIVSHTLEQATTQDKTIGTEALVNIQPNDLIMRDMGYFKLSDFRYIEEQDANWLSRLTANCHVQTIEGENLEDLLSSSTLDVIDQPVFAGEKERLECRLIAIRATDEVRQNRQQQRREEAKQKGKTPCPKGLIRDGWHLMLTSLSPEEASAEEIATLYTSRWSIELQFRGLKGSLNLTGALNRKSNSDHLQALILGAMIFHHLSAKIWNIYYEKLEKKGHVLSLEQLMKSFTSYLSSLRGTLEEIKNFAPDYRHIAYGKRKRKPSVNQAFSTLT